MNREIQDLSYNRTAKAQGEYLSVHLFRGGHHYLASSDLASSEDRGRSLDLAGEGQSLLATIRAQLDDTLLRDLVPAGRRRYNELIPSIPARLAVPPELVSRIGGIRTRSFGEILRALRGLWVDFFDRDRESRICLAMLHGLAERCASRYDADSMADFFVLYLGMIKDGTCGAINLEREASRRGLPVCDAEELLFDVKAQFGYVEEVEQMAARVAFLDERDEEVKSVLSVPLNLLPFNYRHDGAGVAWIERFYPSGVKGQFEPASDIE